MAPRRTTKASSHNSTTAIATRQGSKKARQQSDEDDQETEQFVDAGSVDDDYEKSAEPCSTSAQELLANMVEAQRKRHVGKKRNVIKEYSNTSKDVQKTIDTLFDKHEQTSSSAHEAHLQRLKELLHHKAKLEASMEAKLTALRADYDAHSQDIENVLSLKIRALK